MLLAFLCPSVLDFLLPDAAFGRRIRDFSRISLGLWRFLELRCGLGGIEWIRRLRTPKKGLDIRLLQQHGVREEGVHACTRKHKYTTLV